MGRVYDAFKELCDKKKVVYDDDLIALVQDQSSDMPQVYQLGTVQVTTGTRAVPTATVTLRRDSEEMTDAACGDGPVDATFRVIDRITGVEGTLEDFSLQAITKGEDAVGEVSVRVRYGDSVINAKGSSTDIVEASAKAYINALNRYLFLKSHHELKEEQDVTVAEQP